MNSLSKLIVFAAALSAATLSVHAQTTVIYSDNFNRTGSLNRSGPVVGGDAPAWAQGSTWLSTGFTTNGSKATAATNASSFANGYLPADIRVDSGVYNLELTLTAEWGAVNSWVAFGFATSMAEPSNPFYSNSIGMTYYNRGGDGTWANGAAVASFLGGASDSIALNGVNQTGATPLTMSITLNTHAAVDNFVVTLIDSRSPTGDVVVRSLVRTLTADQINSISALKIGVNNNQEGTFEDLLFTVSPIPEPAALSLLLLLVPIAMCVRRQLRRK